MAGKILLGKFEPALFWSLVLIHLTPVLSDHWCPTLDGPSHLNCARIMSDLWRGREQVSVFFALNPYPEPNILGHMIMAITMLIAPAWVAEKLVLSLAIVGLAYAFRRFSLFISAERPWISALVMPFLLPFCFFMGFINFCLSLPLLLLVLAQVEKNLFAGSNKYPWALGALFLLLYLAHLSTFILGTVVVAGRMIWWQFTNGRRGTSSDHWVFGRIILVMAAPLLLTIGFFLLHGSHAAAPHRFELMELLRWVVDGRAWITFGELETPSTRIIAVSILMLAICGIGSSIKKGWSPKSLFWLIVSSFVFVIYFLLPDTMAGGSLASPRLLLFAMLFISFWIATAPLPDRLLGVGISALICADFAHLIQVTDTSGSLEKEAIEFTSVASALEPSSVVLPLNYGDNWMHSNFSNYVGAERGAIVLDNFVANAPFSPVRWKPERLPYERIGNFSTSNAPCVSIDAYREGSRPLVTHVLTWKLNDSVTDSCTNDVRRQLARDFELLASSPNNDARLYRRK